MLKGAGWPKIFFAVLLCAVFFTAVPDVYPGQATQLRESDVEKLLAQADSYFQREDYKLAIGCYLEASALSQDKANLYRAYFGLSLCYFYLHDTASAAKYLRKAVDTDPEKVISEPAYPQDFVALFVQVQKEIANSRKEAAEIITAPKPVPEKAEEKKVEEAKKTEEEKSAEAAKKEGEVRKTTGPQKTEAKKEPPPLRTKIGIPDETKGGHWEVSGHYSTWSINFIKKIFEDSLIQDMGEKIQDEIVKKSEAIQAGLVNLSYSRNLAFSSEGSNFGFEVRYFSAGRAGTFSLGLALEKTYIKLLLSGTAQQDFTNGGSTSVDVNGSVEAKPLSANVNFRWEIGANNRIVPYFVLGFGFAPLKGTFSYAYSGSYRNGNLNEAIGESQEKTLAGLTLGNDFKIPELLVILQFHFGIKALLVKGLYLLGEAGIWDGFVLRGGLAYRF